MINPRLMVQCNHVDDTQSPFCFSQRISATTNMINPARTVVFYKPRILLPNCLQLVAVVEDISMWSDETCFTILPPKCFPLQADRNRLRPNR